MFTKKPLYNQNTNMKKTIILAWVIILGLGIYIIYQENKTEGLKRHIIDVSEAYERAIQPTELEEILIADAESKNMRIENRKQIEKLEAENVQLRQEEYERAERVKEITGLSFQ